MPKKSVTSYEALKFPYYANLDDTQEYLSEKICYSSIRIRKKVIKTSKLIIISATLVICVATAVLPAQAVGLPIVPYTPPTVRVMRLNSGFSKREIIKKVIKVMPAETGFTEKEVDQLYHFAMEFQQNSLTKAELITKITNLRGGTDTDLTKKALALIGTIIYIGLESGVSGFQPVHVIRAITQPIIAETLARYHLQPLLGKKSGNLFGDSKAVEGYKKIFIMSYEVAMLILETKYGSKFISVLNNELRIYVWQVVKKMEHAGCFGINPDDFGFPQALATQIKANGGLVSFVRANNTLPSEELIEAFQYVIKEFCENRTQSIRMDNTTFGGQPSITFFNEETRQVAIFDRLTKAFISAYKISNAQVKNFLNNSNIGT